MNIPNIEEYKALRFKIEEKIIMEQGREKRLFLEKFQEKVSLALYEGQGIVDVDYCDYNVGESTVYSVLKKVCGELKKKNYAVKIRECYSGLMISLHIEPKEDMKWWHWLLGWRWM